MKNDSIEKREFGILIEKRDIIEELFSCWTFEKQEDYEEGDEETEIYNYMLKMDAIELYDLLFEYITEFEIMRAYVNSEYDGFDYILGLEFARVVEIFMESSFYRDFRLEKLLGEKISVEL